MGINFPASPTDGQVFIPTTATGSGPIFVYRNGAWRRNTGTALRANKIVNPTMQVSQQNGNTAGGSNWYPADQWRLIYYCNNAGAISVARVAKTTPRGSPYRTRMTVTATETPTTSDYAELLQNIEGNRTADFGYGTASAKYSVLRFGFSAPAGTYSCVLQNYSGGASDWWSIVFNFTVAAGEANTDKEYSFVVPPVTGSSSFWPTDNNPCLVINFYLIYDSTFSIAPSSGVWYKNQYSVTVNNTKTALTSGNIFEAFDVGLYLDPNMTGVAPEFQAPDLHDDLQDCLRYWYRGKGLRGVCTAATTVRVGMHHPVNMRVVPTLAIVGSTLRTYDGGVTANATSISNVANTSTQHLDMIVTSSAGAHVAGRPGAVLVDGTIANSEDVYIAVNARM